MAISGTEFSDSEPVTSLIEAARRLDADGIEVWYPANFTALGTNRSMKELAEGHTTVVCVSTGSELGDPGRVDQDAPLLIRALEMAAELGAPVVNTYFGAPPSRDDPTWTAAYARAVEPCLRVAESLGVQIALENEFDAFGHDGAQADVTRRPPALRELVRSVGSPHFGVNFDAANFLCAGVDPLCAYDVLQDEMLYAHVKDVSLLVGPVDPGWCRYRDHEREYQTRAMGSGQVPWDHLLPLLARNDRIRCLTVEPHAALENRAQAFGQAVAHVREMLASSAEAGQPRDMPTCRIEAGP